MCSESWGGYPDAEFLAQLDPALGALALRALPSVRESIDQAAGG